MKLTIERAALFRSLGHVQNVVERRNTIPILAHVLIRAENNRLSLTATDMDLEIIEMVGCDVQQDGGATAPAHTLYDIVRKLPDGAQVEIDGPGDDGVLTLRSGRSRFRLGCLPVDDFPGMAGGELPCSFSLQPADLCALIDRTRFAVSTEETRYYLNGIYVHAADSGGVNVLRAVATDGHRLARMEMALPSGGEGMPGAILPRKTVNELRRLLDDAEETVAVGLSDTKVRFDLNGIVLTSKLIDGTFPDYERVIPSGNDKIMVVDGKTFAEAVDRVSTISTEKSRAVKLSLDGTQMTLSATGSENGSATEEIEVGYQADRLEIGFNSRYLMDILGQIEGNDARFAMTDHASPTVIRDDSGDAALYVLMPMRV